MLRLARSLVLTLLVTPVALAQTRDTIRVEYSAAACPRCAAWNAPHAPFKIFGNSYYVGTNGISSILVTSPQGHILIDGALPTAAGQIAANIRTLGFKPEDVRFILNTHAHYDHAGGLAELQRLTGATIAATEWSARVIERGESDSGDPQFGLAFPYPAAHNVRVIKDNESIRVGSFAVVAHTTPGHTPGGTSWTWRSCEGARCADVLYADSQSPVSADNYLFTQHSGDTVFARSLDKLEHLSCDLLVTPHPEASALFDRARSGTLIDPARCKKFVTAARAAVEARMARERRK